MTVKGFEYGIKVALFAGCCLLMGVHEDPWKLYFGWALCAPAFFLRFVR